MLRKTVILIVLLLWQGGMFAQSNIPLTLLDISFENDFFFYTDRYYTNGVSIKVYNNSLEKLPFYKLLIPGKGSKTYYSMGLTHHMFTPERTYTPDIQYNDHPYSAYLLLGFTKENYNFHKKSRILSRLEVGVLGPLAQGELFQNTIHGNFNVGGISEGWHNQVNNDLCIQYTVNLEKGIINTPYFEFNGYFIGSVGVPHTQASVGAYTRIGYFSNYFRGKSVDVNRKGFEGWFFISSEARIINYNAALQGGTVNQESPHTFYEINKTVYHTKIGGQISFHTISLSATANIVNPEFEYAYWHRWASINLVIGF